MKILITGPSFAPWALASFLVTAFKKLGHKVCTFDYRHSKSTILRHIPLIRSNYTIAYFRRFDPTLDKNFINSVKEHKPDFILVIKGESISAKTITYIRKKFDIPVFLWFPDDPQFHPFMSKYYYKSYDFYLSSSFITTEQLKKKNFNRVEYIPFACDPEIHKKVKLSKSDKKKYECDINFIGTFYFERWKYIKKLKPYNLKIWGKWWKLPLKLSNMLKSYQSKGIYHKDYVKAFNGARIVLNIHLPAMKNGGMKSNMRTFEASGSGAFILCDKTIGIEDLFIPEKEIILYDNINDLKEKVDYYLQNPEKRNTISKNAQKRCYKDHTYLHRAKFILKILKTR